MSFDCYTSRASLRKTMIGGLFISADGSRRFVPDHWLTQAELLHGSRLLRLSYSFCTIEIAGQGLDPILDDAGAGKIGLVQVAPPEMEPGVQPWVSSIIAILPAESPFPHFDGESSDA